MYDELYKYENDDFIIGKREAWGCEIGWGWGRGLGRSLFCKDIPNWNILSYFLASMIHKMSQLTRLWYLSHRRPTKAQASLRISAVSPGPGPSLFAHMEYGSRRRVPPKIRHLAPLDGCRCAIEKKSWWRMKSAIISWAGSNWEKNSLWWNLYFLCCFFRKINSNKLKEIPILKGNPILNRLEL